MAAADAAHAVLTSGYIAKAARRRRTILLCALAIALAAASLGALTIGPADVSAGQAAAAILGLEGDAQAGAIVTGIRLPRLVLGLAAGAVLGVCGAALQGLFRNPLADPGLIGISGGAALAVAFTIVAGASLAPELLASLGPYALAAPAVAGSFAALMAVYALGRRNGVISSAHMLLAGVAVNAIAGAGVGYLTFLSDDQQLRTLTFWMLGSLGGASWDQIIPSIVIGFAASGALLAFAGPLNAYLLGEREARHLGVNVERLKRGVIVLTALGVGAAVAVTGIIGFIGLAAPHIVRLAAGADHRAVLPASALLGALLIVIGDIAARSLVAPAELPIGVLTSALGGPFFLWLLTLRKTLP